MENVEVGLYILAYRKAMGLSHEKLALDAKVSIGRLRDIEHGTANYTRDTLFRIAEALKTAVWVLYIPRTLNDEAVLHVLHETAKLLTPMLQEELSV